MLPEEKIVTLLKNKKLKIAVAESCTGGLISKRITDIPGASDILDMGIVSYANSIKARFLGVSEEILNTVGAVSEQTAAAMAKGVCEAANADIGVSTTGIAGPGGGTKEKPVGLVYISVYFRNGKQTVKKLNLSGSRKEIREQTANAVFETVLNEL
ncbi:MAG: CinA family protein [Clostridia bacterium]|nr:CinA family protein [Clostridia bacterium]